LLLANRAVFLAFSSTSFTSSTSFLFHTNAQICTANLSDPSCQPQTPGLLSPQIEPRSLKNLPAQSKEGARPARFQRPQFFVTQTLLPVVLFRGLELREESLFAFVVAGF
jgi:hypothetical protein